MGSGVAAAIKSRVFADRTEVHRIPFGVFKGVHLELNLRTASQTYLGLAERETFAVIRRALASAEWMVDVGAAKGELAILFAKQPHTRVVAIDPFASELGLFANMAHNRLPIGRVEVLTRFAGVKRQPSFVALDDLSLDHKKRGFVKIDVDGGELEVLESGTRLFSEGNVEALIETHSAELEETCMDWLKRRGYACKIIKNAWWRLLIPEHRPDGPHCRWLTASSA